MPGQVTFQLGQTVRINEGIQDEDLDAAIGGWQCRIVELDPNEKLMLIAFDSITLREVGLDYIERCEEEGMDWAQY